MRIKVLLDRLMHHSVILKLKAEHYIIAKTKLRKSSAQLVNQEVKSEKNLIHKRKFLLSR